MNGEEITKAVEESVRLDSVISSTTAVAIARGYQAPGNEFSAFAHGFEVSVLSFHAEVSDEMHKVANPYSSDYANLSALLTYIEDQGMRA